MSARSEIERHQLSLDSRRPQFTKRSTSLSHLRNNIAADIEVQDPPPTIVDTPSFQPSRRQKSISVCVAALPSSSHLSPPRTIDQYEQQTVRNGIPQSLSAYELHQVRLPALSTSEVFNEPPTMYVYKPRPMPTNPYIRKPPSRKDAIRRWVRKHRHTLCAWIFGITALSAVLVIIILQMKGDFS